MHGTHIIGNNNNNNVQQQIKIKYSATITSFMLAKVVHRLILAIVRKFN